jgi:transcriptional regulator with XRE-family HTH domain
LTAPKVLTIRELRQQGLTIRAIAEKFEVGDSTIDAILSGRTWKHLL